MKIPKKNILIVEDDIGIQNQLKWCFDQDEVVVAGNREEAVALLRRHCPSVVLLDLGLPPDPGGISEGFATMEELLTLTPSTKIIVITGNDQKDNAVKAIGKGCYDFYNKPVVREELSIVVERARNIFNLEKENERLSQNFNDEVLPGLFGRSPQISHVGNIIQKVSKSKLSVLIQGESGTGKELLARALHSDSANSDGPLVAINCAAIPSDLLESELFGYEKGAFTGAAKTTKGKIELANNGTLFLDEIGDFPLGLQPKLLRFLQERSIERVGGRDEINVNVRIVTATHKDLEKEVSEGVFREDLFYRIGEMKIHIPPLRDREGDVILLATKFLEDYTLENNLTVRSFSKDAMDALENHDWPGNVRELENRVKQAAVLANTNTITKEDLDLEDITDEMIPLNLKSVREIAEKTAINRALERTNHNVSKAAKLLGVTRPTLYNLLAKYNISDNNN